MKSVEAPEIIRNTGLDAALRPANFEDFVGQERIKRQLEILVRGALNRNDALPHLIFNGPQGLGKTTLAHILGHRMKCSVRVTNGMAIQKAGDLVALFNANQARDILFIDEIHRLPADLFEVLYGPMEDFKADIMIDKGGLDATSVTLTLPPFTLIAATTQLGALPSPLLQRFEHQYRLEHYTPAELAKIARRTASLLPLGLSAEGETLLSQVARGTPRVLNSLVRWVRDCANSEGRQDADLAVVKEALELKGVEHDGLDATDLNLIRCLVEKFQGGPVGLKSLCSTAGEDAVTIEEVNEPFLLTQGFWQRTQQGRVATPKAWARVGVDNPAKDKQPSLI